MGKVRFIIQSFKIWGHLPEDELKQSFSDIIDKSFIDNKNFIKDIPNEIMNRIKNLITYWKKNYFYSNSKYGYLCDWGVNFYLFI